MLGKSVQGYLLGGELECLIRPASFLPLEPPRRWAEVTTRFIQRGELILQLRCLLGIATSRGTMGCASSSTRSRLDKEDQLDEVRPSSPSSSYSDAPVLMESPASSAAYRQTPTKLATPPPVHPPRRPLHRRRRREPHLDYHLSDRLEMLARYLQRASKADYQEALYAQTQHAIDDLLDNIHSFFHGYEAEKRSLWRLAQTGRVVQQVESFHRTLDAITARCGLAVVAPSGAGPSLPRWQARWRRMRAERLVFFRSYLEDHEAAGVSFSRVRDPSDQLELLTMLKHDAQKFDTLLTADELELLERTFSFVAGCCSSSMDFDSQMHMMSLPEWFVREDQAAAQVAARRRGCAESAAYDDFSRLLHASENVVAPAAPAHYEAVWSVSCWSKTLLRRGRRNPAHPMLRRGRLPSLASIVRGCASFAIPPRPPRWPRCSVVRRPYFIPQRRPRRCYVGGLQSEADEVRSSVFSSVYQHERPRRRASPPA
jgi:hypothetical protein